MTIGLTPLGELQAARQARVEGRTRACWCPTLTGVRQRPTGLSIGGRMMWLRWRAKLEGTRLSTEEGSPMTMQQFPIDGSVNGSGGGDCAREELFVGWRPRGAGADPFTTRQLARLMILRSRIEAGLVGVDDMSEPDYQEPL